MLVSAISLDDGHGLRLDLDGVWLACLAPDVVHSAVGDFLDGEKVNGIDADKIEDEEEPVHVSCLVRLAGEVAELAQLIHGERALGRRRRLDFELPERIEVLPHDILADGLVEDGANIPEVNGSAVDGQVGHRFLELAQPPWRDILEADIMAIAESGHLLLCGDKSLPSGILGHFPDILMQEVRECVL